MRLKGPSLTAAVLAVGLLLACGRAKERRNHHSPTRELRLVSLSPAMTDILFDMGLGPQVVGVSRFCLVPAGHKKKVVGDMLTAETELLLSVRPTHVFLQGPSKRLQNLTRLDPSIDLVSFKLHDISEILRAVDKIGELTRRAHLARRARAAFQQKLERVRLLVNGRSTKRVAFVLDSGAHQIMAAGPGTFIDDLIRAAGGTNAAKDLPGRQFWRKTDPESLLAARPHVLICQVDPSQPNATRRALQQWSRYLNQPGIILERVEVVSDRRWTFPSTRVADLAEPMARIIHPSLK